MMPSNCIFPTNSGDVYFDPARLYTLKLLDFDLGYLSYTFEESHSGHYLQYLCDGAYQHDYKYYEPDNKWRNSVLWEICPVPDEEGPYFTLRNRGLDFGYMAVGDYKSASGFYVEHLYSGAYDKQRKMYERGEKLRDRMLWSIDRVQGDSYVIINKEFKGCLTYTQKKAKSGHYIQVLYGNNYEEQKENYEKGGEWEKSILWEIKLGKK